MPVIGKVGGAAVRGFGLFGGAASGYWTSEMTNAYFRDWSSSNGRTYNGKIYTSPYIAVGSGLGATVTVYDKTGAINFQRAFAYTGTSAPSIYAQAIFVDSSGNIYLNGSGYLAAPVNNNGILTVKLDSTGTILWQKLTQDSIGSAYGYGCTVASSGNVYSYGYGISSATLSYDLYFLKFNSSGALQWQRSLQLSGIDYASACVVDASENTYYAAATSGVGNATVIKIDSAGNIQWSRNLPSAYAWGMCIDSSGNLYVTGGTYTNKLFVWALNSSGTTLWVKEMTDPGGLQLQGYGIALDASNKLYVSGTSAVSGSGTTTDGIIMSFDSSGNLLWQRKLVGKYKPYSLSVGTDGTYAVDGQSPSGQFFVTRLPTDGTNTGTFGGITYTTTSFTVASSTATPTNPGYSLITPSLTVFDEGLTTTSFTPSITFTPM